MPVTARLSRKFYETFGDEIVNEFVDWFNAVDTTYRSHLLELNELNFARFKAEMDAREARIEARLVQLEARFYTRLAATESRILKWNFAFWLGTVGTLIAILKL